MALSDAFQKLRDALEDLGSLETRTYRGEITKEILASGDGATFKQQLEKARESGKLKLVLYTRLDGDGDSDHIYAEEEIDTSLIEAHKAAFDMGREIRQGYLELFKDIALPILNPKK